jgi:hypothetical protein
MVPPIQGCCFLYGGEPAIRVLSPIELIHCVDCQWVRVRLRYRCWCRDVTLQSRGSLGSRVVAVAVTHRSLFLFLLLLFTDAVAGVVLLLLCTASVVVTTGGLLCKALTGNLTHLVCGRTVAG